MVPLGRLELPARGLGNRCSIHLSYRGLFYRGIQKSAWTCNYFTFGIPKSDF